MALINANANDYDGGYGNFAGGIRGLGTAMLQIPAIRAMAAQRAATAQYQQAHAGYETAAANNLNAKTENEKNTSSGHDLFAAGLAKLAKDPTDTDALGDVFAGAGKGFKTDPQNTIKALGLLLAQNGARTGNTNVNQLAELQGGATQLAVADKNNTAKAALPANNQVVIPNGGTLADRLTGAAIAQGGVTLSPGQERFNTPVGGSEIDETPDATGAPLPPKSSASDMIGKRFIAQILANTKMDAGQKRIAIETYRAQTEPETNAPPAAASEGKVMTPDIASNYLDKYGRNRAKAEAAAKADGYTW